MYLPDPANENKKSVTLTGLVISFVLVVGFAIAFVLGKVDKEPGPLMELLWTCAALYLGRRLSFNGKSFGNTEDDSTPSSKGNS